MQAQAQRGLHPICGIRRCAQAGGRAEALLDTGGSPEPAGSRPESSPAGLKTDQTQRLSSASLLMHIRTSVSLVFPFSLFLPASLSLPPAVSIWKAGSRPEVQSPWPSQVKGASPAQRGKVLDCDEGGGPGSEGEPGSLQKQGRGLGTRTEKGASNTYLRVSAHAKLGESVPKAEWWAWLDKRRGLLRKGRGSADWGRASPQEEESRGAGLPGAGHRDRGRSVTASARTPPRPRVSP